MKAPVAVLAAIEAKIGAGEIGADVAELVAKSTKARDALLSACHPADRIIGYDLADTLAKFGVAP